MSAQIEISENLRLLLIQCRMTCHYYNEECFRFSPKYCHRNLNGAESEDETPEIQDKRKHENQVNEKIQDMYNTSTLKTLPT